VLRTFIDEAIDRYPYAVIDNEAGMEHLSRRTTKRMDVLIVASDATKVGLDTAARIFALADEMELKVGRRILIVNRAPESPPPKLREMAYGIGIEEILFFPEDQEVVKLAMTGEPLSGLIDRSILFSMVREMSDKFR
jgi:CO dehydrogenase maturation factor